MRNSIILRGTYLWERAGTASALLAFPSATDHGIRTNNDDTTRHSTDDNILSIDSSRCSSLLSHRDHALTTPYADANCSLPIRLAKVPASLELTEHRVPAPRSQHARIREATPVTGYMYMHCEQQLVERGTAINVQLHADCIHATATLDDSRFTSCGEEQRVAFAVAEQSVLTGTRFLARFER